jgi:predicted nucleic acid-binding protein
MTERLTLIDTSAFIAYERSSRDPDLQTRVSECVRRGVAATCAVIAAEILSGARSQREFGQLQLTLSAFQWLPITAQCWTRAAALGFNLRRKGITVPLTDRLIAVVARANDADLLHRDAHYDLIGDTPDEVAD